MARKKAATSGDGTAEIMQDVMQGIEWPDTVIQMVEPEHQAHAAKIFQEILRTRAPQDWRKWPHDIASAARLAIQLTLIENARHDLDQAGPLVLGGKHGTTPVKNPLIDILSAYNCIANQLARGLHLTLNVKGAEAGASRAQTAASAALTLEHVNSEDGLLAAFN